MQFSLKWHHQLRIELRAQQKKGKQQHGLQPPKHKYLTLHLHQLSHPIRGLVYNLPSRCASELSVSQWYYWPCLADPQSVSAIPCPYVSHETGSIELMLISLIHSQMASTESLSQVEQLP